MNFFRIKKLSDVLAAAGNTGLQKTLGPWDLILMGLGAIIGTGIFVLTGLAAARYAGPAITLSFAMGGIACIFTALAYAELASMLPVSGSAYSYAYVIFGEFTASVIGWAIIMVYTFGAATVASGWSGYALGILEGLGIHLPSALTKIPAEGGIVNLPAIFIVSLLSLFLIRGTSETAKLNGILVFVKLSAICIFVFSAIPHINLDNWAVFAPNGTLGIVAGAGFVFMAYTGFDTLAIAAEECKNPNRDLPLGIIGSLTGSAILYILVAGILTAIVPYTSLENSEPMAYALRINGIGIGAKLVATGAIAGMTTVILSQIYGQSRLLLVMARDGLLPKPFARLNQRFATPHLSLILSGIIIIFFAGLMPVATLGQLGSMATLVVFGFVSLCVMILRYQRPDEKRTFRCPAVYWIASASVILCAFMLSQLLIVNWKPFLGSFLIGIAVYFTYGYWFSTMNPKRLNRST